MRIANIIIAHKNPDQLVELIKQYPEEYFHNWVHIDSRTDFSSFKSLMDLKNVTLLPRRKVVWAGYSFVKVTIEAFQIIKATKEKFSYYNLISGMDFPIRSTVEFHEFLSESYQKEKKEFFQISEIDSNWPASHRFEKYHLNDFTMKGRYFLERIINKILPKRNFYDGKMTPYGRSAWFTASSDFIEYSLNFFEENKDYLNFFKSVWCPDELVFCTLIMNSPFKNNLASNNLRYIDWSEGKANPKTLKIEDKCKLLESGMFLARKFDTSIDSAILEEIKNEFI